MKIYIGADHGGFELKESLKREAIFAGHTVVDLGPETLRPDDDYPVFAFKVAEKVADDLNSSLGILICRSGNGMAIAANKVHEIRAALCFTTEHAEKAREHDHANILVLDADYDTSDSPVLIVQAFLNARPDMDGRHLRRVGQISEYEQKQ